MRTILNNKYIDAQSMSSDVTGGWIDLLHSDGFAVEYAVTNGSSPSGTLKVQASNDGVQTNDLGGSYSVAISANTTGLLNYSGAKFRYMRVIYSRSSGGGTLDVNVCSKGF
ncbi:MAG: hypothetical protein E6R03_11180 [Hyphomicrobiaceae bacterium]|nr:MAG: hypothetical protein E6R03_11180 [Hyphomicrobiaceae bacterium]